MKHEDNLAYLSTHTLSTGETESFVWNAYRSNATKVQAAVLIGLGFLFWSGAQAFFPPSVVDAVHFLDVGQGDAALITLAAPSKREPPVRILVDGGRDGTILSALSEVQDAAASRYIDLLILSHQDTDHYGGLIRVLEQYEVGALISNGNQGEGDGWRNFLEHVEAKNIPHHILTEGNTITYNNAQIEILLPTNELRTQESINEASLAFTLAATYGTGTTTVLFTGDVGLPAEETLLAKDIPFDVDILKVGHHGSKHSSSPAFIHEASPTISIISVGKNSYGHPAPEVLDTLARAGSVIYTTLEHGTIRIPLNPATAPTPKAADRGFLASAFLGMSEDSSTTITLQEALELEQEMTLVPVDTCSFESPSAIAPKTVRINEIAWMGAPSGATHEWIELLRMDENPVDISGWQVINGNGRVHATFPQGSVLHEEFAIAARSSADKALSLAAETHFTGSIKNKDESIRLFTNKCELVDEILVSSWPAGDNASKRTMERLEDDVWVDSLISGGTPRLHTSGAMEEEQNAHEKNTTETAEDAAYIFTEFEQLDDGTFSVPIIAEHLKDTEHDIKIVLQNEDGSDISETYNKGMWRASLYYLPTQCIGTACDVTLRLRLTKKHETFSGNATLLIRIREHGTNFYIEHRAEVFVEEHAYEEKIPERKVAKTTSVPAKKETSPSSSISAVFPETITAGESITVLVSGKDFTEASYDIKVSIEADRIFSRTYANETWRSSQFYLPSVFTGPTFTDLPVTLMISTSTESLPSVANLVIRTRTGDESGIELFRQQVYLQVATSSVDMEEELSPSEDEEPVPIDETHEEPPPPEPPVCININTADETALVEIIQIGPALATKIILERTSERGPFISIDDLIRVSGIGPATITKIHTQGRVCT